MYYAFHIYPLLSDTSLLLSVAIFIELLKNVSGNNAKFNIFTIEKTYGIEYN